MRRTSLARALVWGLAVALAAAVTAGADGPEADAGSEVLDDAELSRRGARIGEISIRVVDVFDTSDPAEDRRLFRLVNRLHPKTRESVIRRQLLVAPGDPYQPRLLRESERLLRRNRYLRDAEIRPVGVRRDRVDLEVEAHDVWTLTGGVHFAREGGENQYRFEVQDSNFLGTGKDITVSHGSSVDRTTSVVRYRDPNLAGSRTRLELWLGENSDGDLRRFGVERPFYSLDSRWAAGLAARFEERVDSLYDLGEQLTEFRHDRRYVELYWGRSAGLRGTRSLRWLTGLTYERRNFAPATPEPAALKPAAAGPPAPGLPADRTLAYPWLGLELVEDRFIETRQLARLARTEDYNLGRRLELRLGWSSPSWGGDRDLAVVESGFSIGARPSERSLMLVELRGTGRWGTDGWQNLVVGGEASLFWRNWGEHGLFVRLAGDLAHELDGERQLLLGGDSGLRGYPLRYQDGDRRLLLSVEQRFYTDWHPLRLLHVGAAVFFDMGRAWFAGVDDPTELGLLRDVGFGLRLSPSRSGRGTMVHLDVAFPLDGSGSIRGVQWLVTSRESF